MHLSHELCGSLPSKHAHAWQSRNESVVDEKGDGARITLQCFEEGLTRGYKSPLSPQSPTWREGSLFSYLCWNFFVYINPLWWMMLLSFINGSTYLKKDNSLRKRSKCVKITRYIEQTLGKKSTVFWRTPCAKTYRWGVPPSQQGSKWHSPSPLL